MQSLRDLWAYRWTILAFVERDVRAKHKQTVLGVASVIPEPLDSVPSEAAE